MTERKVTITKTETAFQGHMRLLQCQLRHELFAGGMSAEINREVIDRGSAVAVLPYDPVRDEVVLIEQFRIGPYVHGGPAWTYEFVAGLVEPNEDFSEVARREAKEEAGLDLGHLQYIFGFYTSPGALSEFIELFWARVDATQASGLHGLADEGEDIKVHVLSFAEVHEKLQTGFFTVGPALIALQWLALNRDRIRAEAGL